MWLMATMLDSTVTEYLRQCNVIPTLANKDGKTLMMLQLQVK